jgi:hypothetical protein
LVPDAPDDELLDGLVELVSELELPDELPGRLLALPAGSFMPEPDERLPVEPVPEVDVSVLSLQPASNAATAAMMGSCFFIMRFRFFRQSYLFHVAKSSQSGEASLF